MTKHPSRGEIEAAISACAVTVERHLFKIAVARFEMSKTVASSRELVAASREVMLHVDAVLCRR